MTTASNNCRGWGHSDLSLCSDSPCPPKSDTCHTSPFSQGEKSAALPCAGKGIENIAERHKYLSQCLKGNKTRGKNIHPASDEIQHERNNEILSQTVFEGRERMMGIKAI